MILTTFRGLNMDPAAKLMHAKKAKKKQVKDEMDRIKQAEKKRRRLEKALATSAAIRAELEKKKQMKKEEQQRLDEEGAAIAEAVALHVLLGEDSDESCKIVLQEDGKEFDPWNYGGADIGLFMNNGRSSLSNETRQDCPSEGSMGGGEGGLIFSGDEYGSGYDWNNIGYCGNWSNHPSAGSPEEGSFYLPSYLVEDSSWGSADDISASLIAAQAVSSLQIGEDSAVGSVFFNGY